MGQLLEVAGREVELFGEEALTGFGDDEMNAGHARVGLEQSERFLRQDGATGSGHTYGDDLRLRGWHVRPRIIQSRSGLRASQEVAASKPMGTLYWGRGRRKQTGQRIS